MPSNDSKKLGHLVFWSVFLVFMVMHIVGLSRPLHQDEYKWVLYAHPEILPPGTVTHPPLTEFIYTRLGPIVGDSNFRYIPFAFSILNFFLLFYLVKYLYNKKTALISVSVFTLSFFSLLASLTVDVDGAIMPFFFLLLLIGYYKWKGNNFLWSRDNSFWIILIVAGTLGGFLIKVSFLLAVGAVFLDFLIEKKVFNDRKKLLKYMGYTALGVASLILALVLSKFIFPFFNLEKAITYWLHFWNSSSFFDRGWFQTFIQCAKSILFASPFLVFIPFLLNKKDISKLKLFIIFLIFAFIFYVVLLDFSIGALDKYLQLLVLPLTIFVSVVIARMLELKDIRTKKFLLSGIIFSVVLFLLQFLPHYVPPLYPKTEWISRMASLKWNFLYPFSGGSGPLGFYVSFLFLALSWILGIVALAFTLTKSEYKKLALMFMIPIGLVYNGVFINEYLFGTINGSAPTLVINATEYIKNNPDIKMVTVYNDNGGWNIQEIGKYRKRLYIDPKFDLNVKVDTLNQYKEHYLVVDIPHIDSNSPYQKYFNSCKVAYKEVDQKISATVYDCRGIPDFKI